MGRPKLYSVQEPCLLADVSDQWLSTLDQKWPFYWLMAKYWVGCLQEAFNEYNTFVIQKTTYIIYSVLEFYNMLKLSWLSTTKDFKTNSNSLANNKILVLMAFLHPQDLIFRLYWQVGAVKVSCQNYNS